MVVLELLRVFANVALLFRREFIAIVVVKMIVDAMAKLVVGVSGAGAVVNVVVEIVHDVVVNIIRLDPFIEVRIRLRLRIFLLVLLALVARLALLTLPERESKYGGKEE